MFFVDLVRFAVHLSKELTQSNLSFPADRYLAEHHKTHAHWREGGLVEVEFCVAENVFFEQTWNSSYLPFPRSSDTVRAI
jgi:hypothetical protein